MRNPTREEPIIANWTWIDTIAKQLDLSDVETDEQVVVLSDRRTHRELRSATVLALQRLGATVTDLVHNGSSPVLATSSAVTAALAASDLMVDLSTPGLALDPDLGPVLADGTRLLSFTLTEPAELEQLNPHPGLVQRVERARVRLASAAELTVLSQAGTSLTIDLHGAPAIPSVGTAVEPGDVARWPAGDIAVHPSRDAIAGRVIAMPGDVLWEPRRFVSSPFALGIDKNHVTEIKGESGDADLMRSMLETRDDRATYSIPQIRLGMNFCRGPQPGPFDERLLAAGGGPLAAGTVSLSVGHDQTLTLVLRGATVLLDGVELLCDGVLQGDLAPDVYEQAELS